MDALLPVLVPTVLLGPATNITRFTSSSGPSPADLPRQGLGGWVFHRQSPPAPPAKPLVCTAWLNGQTLRLCSLLISSAGGKCPPVKSAGPDAKVRRLHGDSPTPLCPRNTPTDLRHTCILSTGAPTRATLVRDCAFGILGRTALGATSRDCDLATSRLAPASSLGGILQIVYMRSQPWRSAAVYDIVVYSPTA